MSSKKKISLEELENAGKSKHESKLTQKEKEREEAQETSNAIWRKRDHLSVQRNITGWMDFLFAGKLLFFFSVIAAFNFLMLFSFFPDISESNTSQISLIITLILLALSQIIYFYANGKVKREMLAEKEWIDQQEFVLIAYPDIFVYRSYSVLNFSLKFKKETNQPGVEYLLELFSTLPLEVEFDGDSSDPYKFQLRNTNASKFNRHRRWACKWIHKAVDKHFSALHTKYPIEEIVFENGTNELPFEWWVARKNPIWKLS
ncbi:MAG: hypothetical protein GQ574_26095 [Crocinitomix sp.]|nr:hypothetical protein [Crocinitomix sp.]